MVHMYADQAKKLAQSLTPPRRTSICSDEGKNECRHYQGFQSADNSINEVVMCTCSSHQHRGGRVPTSMAKACFRARSVLDKTPPGS